MHVLLWKNHGKVRIRSKILFFKLQYWKYSNIPPTEVWRLIKFTTIFGIWWVWSISQFFEGLKIGYSTHHRFTKCIFWMCCHQEKHATLQSSREGSGRVIMNCQQGSVMVTILQHGSHDGKQIVPSKLLDREHRV